MKSSSVSLLRINSTAIEIAFPNDEIDTSILSNFASFVNCQQVESLKLIYHLNNISKSDDRLILYI